MATSNYMLRAWQSHNFGLSTEMRREFVRQLLMLDRQYLLAQLSAAEYQTAVTGILAMLRRPFS